MANKTQKTQQPLQADVGTTGDRPEFEEKNTVGPVSIDQPSAEQLGQMAVVEANQAGNRNDEVSSARTDKFIHERWPELNDDDLEHLPILRPGTSLEQGSTYFDLNNPDQGPIKAIGGQTATTANRYIAKNQVDPYLWNRLVPSDRGQATEPKIERPPQADHGSDAQQSG